MNTTKARKLVLGVLAWTLVLGASAANATKPYHRCMPVSTSLFAAGQIQAKRMSCTRVVQLLDAVANRARDGQPPVGHFYIRGYRCVGFSRQGNPNPYIHLACRGVRHDLLGRAMRANLGP